MLQGLAGFRAPGVGWHKSRYPLNQRKGVRSGATARQYCRAKTAQEKDLSNLTGIVGALPIPCAFSVGAAKGCCHCLAQTGGFNNLPGSEHGQKRASCGQQRTRTLFKCAMRGERRSAKRCVRKDVGHWWDLRESRKGGSRPDTLSQTRAVHPLPASLSLDYSLMHIGQLIGMSRSAITPG